MLNWWLGGLPQDLSSVQLVTSTYNPRHLRAEERHIQVRCGEKPLGGLVPPNSLLTLAMNPVCGEAGVWLPSCAPGAPKTHSGNQREWPRGSFNATQQVRGGASPRPLTPCTVPTHHPQLSAA